MVMVQTIQNSKVAIAVALLMGTLSVTASGQTSPAPTDAGKTLDALKPTPRPLAPGKALTLPNDIRLKVDQGGRTVKISALRFTGNEGFSAQQLYAALEVPKLIAQPLDMAGLRQLTDSVTDWYRANGYPFAKAFLTAGSLKGEDLTITVVEGRYGKVEALSDQPKVVEGAGQFLAGLKPGGPILTRSLERATLLLNDLPGISATPVMKPGESVGLGDLNVVIEEDEKVTGHVSVDNSGSHYAGELRVLGGVSLNHNVVFGDQLSFLAQAPMQGNWLAAAHYSLPIGADGARLKLSKAKTEYELKDEFEGFRGSADEQSVQLSYPVLRSRQRNVTVALTRKLKNLKDRRLTELDEKKSRATPVQVSFDARDDWFTGGITYGAFTWVRGDLSKPSSTERFQRWALDVSRVQRLGSTWTMSAHVFVQNAQTNLDSSEGFSLGGASGVRAYPTGEASGDEGWLAQVEARKALGDAQLYVFYDHGRVQVDARPAQVASPMGSLERAGLGLGVRGIRGPMNYDFAVAWRTRGGAPTTTAGDDSKPRLWFSAGYAF